MTQLTMNLEECLQAILECKFRTLYINPESDDILPMLKNTLDILGFVVYINTRLIDGRYLVIIVDNLTISPEQEDHQPT